MPPFTLRHLCLRIGSPQNGQDAALLEISLPQVGHWIKFAMISSPLIDCISAFFGNNVFFLIVIPFSFRDQTFSQK